MRERYPAESKKQKAKQKRYPVVEGKTSLRKTLPSLLSRHKSDAYVDKTITLGWEREGRSLSNQS